MMIPRVWIDEQGPLHFTDLDVPEANGETRRLDAGSMILFENVGGRGHIDRIDDQETMLAFLVLPEYWSPFFSPQFQYKFLRLAATRGSLTQRRGTGSHQVPPRLALKLNAKTSPMIEPCIFPPATLPLMNPGPIGR